MKATTLLICLSAIPSLSIAAEESVVKPEIESVGLFKNGIAVVRAAFPIEGAGTYRWDRVPQVIHGTFWVESDGEVAVQSTTRRIEESDESGAPGAALQQELAGKEVTVTLRQGGATQASAITGMVRDVPSRPGVRQWDTNYASLNPSPSSYYWWNPRLPSPTPTAPAANFLILEGESGTRRYIDLSGIATVEAKGPFGAVKRLVDKPVLVFDVRKAPANGGVVRVSWLTKGLAWMPSYRVDLTDPEKLSIRQNAVVRNESDDLDGTEIQLISGFPSVHFGAVDSPLWQGTSLASFFQQINQSAAGPASRNVLSQQAVYSNAILPGGGQPVPELKEQGEASADIHYESIGKHTLKGGDSLSVDIASATSAYERVVEWVVPDGRDERGRYSRNNETPPDEMAWDAVRFANPFKFPMTTAAALVIEEGKFRGQNQTEWVNPGQRACLRITRALSVQTESSEIEEEGKRDIVWIAGDDYRRTVVQGRLVAKNYRGKEITMTIRREFSGKLIEAEANPESQLRAQGVYSVNPRRQLDWTIKIPAGGEKELTYRYEVLVDN